MKVACHAGQLLQPVPGGIGRYTHSLLRVLPTAGVDVVAFAAGARPPGVPRRVDWIDLGPPHGSVRYECWNRLGRPFVRLDVDVVHAPSLAVPPVRDAALVVTVHDIAFLRIPHVTTRRGVSFHRRALGIAKRHADLVLAPSSFTRVELIREGFSPEDVQVALLGVDPAPARTDDDVDAAVASVGIDAPYVLTVGTVEPRKDLPTIADAVERLRARGAPDLELLVVGPPGWGRVERIDRPFVRVVGEQPWPVVDALIRRSAACCIASRYEGFGLPALEALARGAALAVADGSALEEVVGDAALLFPAGDVEACTAALERLLDDAELRARLDERGRARAAELTWRHSAEAHAAAYRAGRHPPGSARLSTRRLRAVRLLLDVSAVPARPVGAGMYTVALASGLAGRTDVELHLLARRDDAVRWAELAPTAEVHADAPVRRPARLAWEQARGAAVAKHIGADVWHGPHYTMPLARGRPVRGHRPRPHLLRPSRVARAHEGRVLRTHDPRRRAPRRGARVRERLHGRAAPRDRAPACRDRCGAPRRRPRALRRDR